jgi:hypothetical protein
MTTNNTKKNENYFVCECCDFETSKKTDYSRHILTMKHKNNVSTTDDNKKNDKKYECECGKEYNDRAGLWRHKKKCIKETINEEKEKDENNITPDLIIEIIKQNQQLQKQNYDLQTQVLELCKNGTHSNNNNSNNNNSHNKTFNLQFFLNETCKDAMNIMDFVDSIKIQLSDLEKVGQIGFVEGISNIIVKNLNSLDETKRPVHCTDSKREVMYVKDEDKWEKENETKVKLRKAIKNVAYKNTKILSEFRTKHPDCLKSTSKKSDQYNKLVMEAMGGKGDNDSEKEDKIIKNIAKEVTIAKAV